MTASKIAKSLLTIAEQDLASALKLVSGPRGVAAYHVQQAAEKTVKAVLISSGIQYPHWHDIAALNGLLPENHTLRATLSRLEELTPYATMFRYPDPRTGAVVEPPPAQDLRSACQEVAHVMLEVYRTLGLRRTVRSGNRKR